MIKRIYLVILVLLFATPGLFAQQTVEIGDVIVGPGTIEVPVYMTGFTNVNGFQLAFNVDPNILNSVQPDDASYFITGGGKFWTYNVIREDEFVIQFLETGFSMVGGIPVFFTHAINGQAFRLKFNYSGGFPADINFNKGNSSIMVGGNEINLNNVNFVGGTVAPDPDIVLGTLKLEGEPEALIGSEYIVPFSMQGIGFDAIRGIQVELTFDPNKLVFNGLDNVPGSGVTFEAIQDGDLINFVWIGSEIDFTTEKTIANLRFTYNSNEEALVEFTPNTRVSVAAGEIPFANEKAVFTPKDLDLQLTVVDVYQYSGANVDIPIVLSGVEDNITAGAITIRLGFDPSLMSYASMQSNIAFSPPTLTNGVVVLNFVAGPGDAGYTLANGTIATLRFNFLKTGMTDINYLFGPAGTAFTTFEGGVIPISYINGSAEVTVSGIVYDALLDARDKTNLVLTESGFNEILETTTYPASFITSSGQPFFFPAITDEWMLDGFLEFSEDLPAGTILTLAYGEEGAFDVVLEEGLEAGTLLSYKDMVLSAFPEDDVDWPLLDEAGNIEVWTISIRSPLTFDVTMTSVLSTAADGFITSEDGEYPGFVLAMDDVDFTIHGDPLLLFAFNGEVALGQEFVYCYDVPVTVSIAEKLEGGEVFDIYYTINGVEDSTLGLEVGDDVFGPEIMVAGTYVVTISQIVDNYGRNLLDPAAIYLPVIVTINPEPFVYFAFNGETAAPESEFVYCYDEEITVTLSEIGVGVAPFEVTYTVNGVEETVTGLDAGDELFSSLMAAGTYEIVVTSIFDGNGCAVSEDVLEAVYYATVVVNPEPVLAFEFNGVLAATDSEFVYCYDEDVVVTLGGVHFGAEPFAIVYEINGEEVEAEVDLEDNVLFSGLPGAGTYEIVITSIVDANGCAVTTPELFYTATVVINPEPVLAFDFNGELAGTGSEFVYCYDQEVVITLTTVHVGTAPFVVTVEINGEEEVHEGVVEADVLFEGLLAAGTYEIVITSIVDANGCAVTTPELFYNATVVINEEPVLAFGFNEVLAATGSEFVYCYDEVVSVSVATVHGGLAPFEITIEVNGVETVYEEVEEGDVLFAELLEAGTYEVVVTSIVDANGCAVTTPELFYTATVVINPEPFVYFAFNGETAAPDKEFVYCFDEEVTVTLSEIGVGVAPFEVTYTVNGEEATVAELEEGDVLFSSLMEAGTYEIVVTSIIDGNGCAVSEDVLNAVYYATVVINPMPAVLFAFNDEIAVTGSEFVYCFDEVVTVSLSEIFVGEGPVTLHYVLNDDEAVEVVADAGDVLFSDVLPVGEHTLVVTSLVDANGCAVAGAADIYTLTIVVNPMPAVLFAFNDEIAVTGSEFAYCYDREVTVTLAEILAGSGPVEITYVLNEEEPVTVIADEGDELFSNVLPVGEHTLVVIALTDANGCAVVNPELIYNLTITVNPMPAVLFSFNGEVASTGSVFEYCFDEVVTVAIEEIVSGMGPIEITYVLNEEEPVTVSAVEGDELFSGVLPVGVHTLVVTSMIDANVCNVEGVEDIYTLTIIIHAEPLAEITADNDLVLCDGNMVTLTAAEAAAYLWSTGEDTQSIVVKETGSYFVTITDVNGCVSTSETVEVVVNPLPVAEIAFEGLLEFCDGGSVVLTASEGTSYLWSNGTMSQTLTVSESGTYTVTVTNEFGCSMTSEEVVVIVNPLPVVEITASGDTEFCAGGSVMLTATEAESYLWSSNETTQTITVTESGVFSVTITDANGCVNTSAEVEVVVNPLPEAVISVAGELEFCDGGSVILTASAGDSYLWSNDETTRSITVSASGSFSVTVTSAAGCSATSDVVTVVVNPLPEAVITGSGELTFCAGGSVILTASEGASYLWSNDAVTRSITVDASGSFSVTVTNDKGCSSTSDVVAVVVNPLPVANILVSGDLAFCEGGSVTLMSSEAVSYLWSNNATTRSITVGAAGAYSVTVTDANGCSNTSDEVVVVVHALPVVTCPADTIVMLTHPAFALSGALPAGGTYTGPGVTNGVFNAIEAGVGDKVITYTVTNEHGCTAVCTFVITVKLDTSVPAAAEQISINLYPNPARTDLNVDASHEIKEIRMVDMLGQVVFTDVVGYKKYVLNVSDFKTGVYFVQVLTEKGFTTHRVQVTR